MKKQGIDSNESFDLSQILVSGLHFKIFNRTPLTFTEKASGQFPKQNKF